jgi:hypothetical protein
MFSVLMIFLGKGLAGHKNIGYWSVDYFHCEQCDRDYWFSPSRQKCLRKDMKCPVRSRKNKRQRKFWQHA